MEKLSESLERARLEELKMIGFRPAGRSSADVIARVKVCWDRVGKPGSGKFVPSVQVVVMKEGRQLSWISKLEPALRKKIAPMLKKLGMYPSEQAGESCVGLAEIGMWWEQNSWSDDSYLGIRADNDALAKAVGEVLQSLVAVGGGGVPGSSYRGSGMSGGNGEYKYHYHSFGIGD